VSIKIFYDEVEFRLKGQRKILKAIEKIIIETKNTTGDLSFVFTSDETIRKINNQFLDHDYNTDVISFNYNVEDIVNGEIYISVETVKKNSVSYDVSIYKEIKRVMIHGVLHLIGYDDKSDKQLKIMRKMEDIWLKKMED
jgi:probable rRNA maturation factor